MLRIQRQAIFEPIFPSSSLYHPFQRVGYSCRGRSLQIHNFHHEKSITVYSNTAIPYKCIRRNGPVPVGIHFGKVSIHGKSIGLILQCTPRRKPNPRIVETRNERIFLLVLPFIRWQLLFYLFQQKKLGKRGKNVLHYRQSPLKCKNKNRTPAESNRGTLAPRIESKSRIIYLYHISFNFAVCVLNTDNIFESIKSH